MSVKTIYADLHENIDWYGGWCPHRTHPWAEVVFLTPDLYTVPSSENPLFFWTAQTSFANPVPGSVAEEVRLWPPQLRSSARARDPNGLKGRSSSPRKMALMDSDGAVRKALGLEEGASDVRCCAWTSCRFKAVEKGRPSSR